MTSSIRSVTRFLLCTLALPLCAQEARINPDHRWFQADVIVFRHAQDNSGEAWPPLRPHSWPASAINLKPVLPELKATPLPDNLLQPATVPQPPIAADIVREPYIQLPASEQELFKQGNILNNSKQFEVLAQSSWRMPVDASLQEIPVKVQASGNGDNGYLLEGTITVSASRFLHMDADFWFNELAPEGLASKITKNEDSFNADKLVTSGEREGLLINVEGKDNPVRVARNFHLQQHRRIRNTAEVQYLDSPVIGVLFKLTPYERPQTILEVGEKEKVTPQNR